MKQYTDKYLTASERMCNRVLETISGSDTGRMQEASEELKAHLLTVEDARRGKIEVMSRLGVNSDIEGDK